MAETRALKTMADAGGLEAVLSALFMNRHSSNVALSIVCVHMLKLYAGYNKPDACRWGVWTDKQLNMGLECITGAMRKFPHNLDLQCCAISCFLTLCLQDGIPRNAHMYICHMHVARQGVRQLLMIAMHTHENAIMYVDVCKLLFMFSNECVTRQPAPSVSCEVVALQALRHSLTLRHIESICFITKLLCQLCHQEQSVHHDLLRNPAAIPLCLQILQEVRANIETETPEQAVQKQTTIVMATTLLKDITGSHDAGRVFLHIPGSIASVVRAITDSHELCMLQPAALFHYEPFITTQMCVTVQNNLCEMLSKMELDGYIFPIMQCGAMQQLVNVIRETDSDGVRLMAFRAAKTIAYDDNGERLIVLKAGGLQVFANQILSLPLTGVKNRLREECVACLVHLAEFPVYATAMIDLGFIGLLQKLPPSPNKDILMPLLQHAEHNPVYPP